MSNLAPVAAGATVAIRYAGAMIPGLDVAAVRRRFPALADGNAYLDGPAGTQVPRAVIDAIAGLLEEGVSNQGGRFASSRLAGEVVSGARQAAADLMGTDPEGVVFGPNMTTLTFAFSRALARRWRPGDEVVVTSLDHDANVTPWRLAAEERGAVVRRVEFDPADGTLPEDAFRSALGPRTRLAAFTAASNALGTVTPFPALIEAAQGVGAVTYLDAVHHSAHRPVDLFALGVDFVAASSYKFFGPHLGLVAARPEVLMEHEPYRLEPAPAIGPGRWETGTPSFELLAGLTAAVEHLASLGSGPDRRARVLSGYAAIADHEAALCERFMEGLESIPAVRLHGIDDRRRMAERVATFAVSVDGVAPGEVARRLGEDGIFVWDGDYYAPAVMRRLGLAEAGGLVRIGFVHYNTEEEVDRVLAALATF
ncbi:MAG: cysteine desulfurase-like protein [Acidimicrobiia bacterium]|nr:MAG: cysteine desulfurase-like protein [Acidimicrobiia bacterium]